MGACTFSTVASGKTAEEAFRAARERAQYEHGHGGYTGTIAEKSQFTVINCPDGTNPSAYASALIDDGDPRIDDKWGPAGCIDLGNNKFLFFGWASE